MEVLLCCFIGKWFFFSFFFSFLFFFFWRKKNKCLTSQLIHTGSIVPYHGTGSVKNVSKLQDRDAYLHRILVVLYCILYRRTLPCTFLQLSSSQCKHAVQKSKATPLQHCVARTSQRWPNRIKETSGSNFTLATMMNRELCLGSPISQAMLMHWKRKSRRKSQTI